MYRFFGAQNETRFRKVRTDYLKILGYYICNHGHGQVVRDKFGRVVCDYTKLPSFAFMEKFVRLYNQQKPIGISLDFLESAWKKLEKEDLEANYAEAFGLSWKACKFSGKLKLYTKAGKCVHDDKNFFTVRQIKRFLNMSPEEKEGIVQAFIEDTNFCFIEKIKLEYKCKLEAEYAAEEEWWNNNISTCMNFLNF
jgi:hypothetical protein